MSLGCEHLVTRLAPHVQLNVTAPQPVHAAALNPSPNKVPSGTSLHSASNHLLLNKPASVDSRAHKLVDRLKWKMELIPHSTPLAGDHGPLRIFAVNPQHLILAGSVPGNDWENILNPMMKQAFRWASAECIFTR